MYTQPDSLMLQLSMLEPDVVDASLARGLAYALAFVMPLWLLIAASVLALQTA